MPGLVKKAVVLAGGTGIAQLISIAALPILVRIYSPREFGIFALFSAVSWMAAVVATWQLEHRVILQGADRRAALLVQLICTWGIAVAAALSAVFIGLLLSHALVLPSGLSTTSLAFLLFLTVSGISLTQAMRAWLIRLGAFSWIARGTVVASVVTATVAILPAFIFGPEYQRYGLLMAQASGLLVTALVWLKLGRPPVPGGFFRVRWKRIGAIARAEWYVGLVLTLSNAAKTGYGRMPTPVITSVGGAVAAGYFGLVERVIAAPSSLLAQSVCAAFRNQIGEFAARREHGAIVRLYWRIVMVAFGIACPAYLLGALLAPEVFSLIFGADWRTAGEYASILLFGEIFVFVLATVEDAAVLLDLNRYRLFWHVGQLTMIACLWGAVFAGWITRIHEVLWILVGIRIVFALIDFSVIAAITVRVRRSGLGKTSD